LYLIAYLITYLITGIKAALENSTAFFCVYPASAVGSMTVEKLWGAPFLFRQVFNLRNNP